MGSNSEEYPCRICFNESYLYSNIYDHQQFAEKQFLDILNDLLQLDIEYEDGFPQFVCAECYKKVFDFELLKRTAHEVKEFLLYSRNSFQIEYIKSENVPTEDEEIVTEEAEDDMPPLKLEDSEPEEETVDVVSSVPDCLTVSGEINSEAEWHTQEHRVVDVRTVKRSLEIWNLEGCEMPMIQESNDKADEEFAVIANGGIDNNEEKREECRIKVTNLYKGRLRNKMKNINEDLADQYHKSNGNIRTCRYCKQECTSIQELENHYKKQHRWHCGGSLTNRENNVFENTDTIGEVNSKIGNVQREAEYSENNTEGSENGIAREDYRKHAVEMRTEGRPLQSKLCSKKFTQGGHVKEQERVHMGERPFQCKLCSKKFTQSENLKRHKRVHTGERPFQCKLCSKKFTQSENLKRHKRVHTGERSFQCKLCSKKFTRKGHLKEHERFHTGERPFHCKLCSKKYTTSGDLKRHERVHTGERPFQCKLCSKKFTLHQHLKIHERVHTGERPFQCKLCSKKFTQRGCLDKHERIHTGDRPFQCKLCSKKYTTNRGLKLHENVHIGERPFQCKLCSKKFIQSGDLKTHERVHTGERPYQCKLCSKKFTQSENLKRHERVHTGRGRSNVNCVPRNLLGVET